MAIRTKKLLKKPSAEVRNQNMMTLIRKVHGMIDSPDIEKHRHSQDQVGALLGTGKDILIREVEFQDMAGEWVSVNRAHMKKYVILYCHGGGYSTGSSIYARTLTTKLAASTSMDVLSFDYRLAPENPYPAGLDDCVDAIEFARKHALDWGADPLRISAGGDSSGGNLAIASSLRLPDALSSLVLFYPVTKAFADGSQSWNAYGKGYGLDARLMEEFNRAYTIDANALHPLISPACAPFAALTHLPPVLLIGAGRDILCQQGTDFAALLGSLGVEVEHIMIQGAVHLFITVDGQPTARRQSVDIAHRWLSRKQ